MTSPTDRPDPAQPARLAPAAELVDIVDADDVVVRTLTRAEMRAGRLRHRAVFIAVRHPDGRLLIHRRSLAKDLWSGWWDLAVGGVVGAGETYDDAACRELAEEVGVHDVVPTPIDGGEVRAYDDADVSLLGRCYSVTTAGPFEFADGEVIEAAWVTLAEVAHLLTERPFLPDSAALVLPLLLVPPPVVEAGG